MPKSSSEIALTVARTTQPHRDVEFCTRKKYRQNANPCACTDTFFPDAKISPSCERVAARVPAIHRQMALHSTTGDGSCVVSTSTARANVTPSAAAAPLQRSTLRQILAGAALAQVGG